MHFGPIRAGEPLEGGRPAPLRTVAGDDIGTVALANAGMIGPTLRATAGAASAWRRIPIAERVAVARTAGTLLLDATLPMGDAQWTYAEAVDGVRHMTGVPARCVREGFEAIARELARVESLLTAASPTGDLRVYGDPALYEPERPVHWTPRGEVVAVVAPGNVVGVHAVWAPLLVAGFPVVLKPSLGDPITPLRLLNAFTAAGAPAELWSMLPLAAGDTSTLTRMAPATIAFGEDDTLAGLPNLTHGYGPGRSMSVVTDAALQRDDVRAHVLDGIVADAGRGCVNTSVVVVIGDGDAGVRALAADLMALEAHPLTTPAARLGALPDDPAEVWGARLDAVVAEGARDWCAEFGDGTRRRRTEDGTILLPALIEVTQDTPALRWEVPGPVAWVVRWPTAVLTRGLDALDTAPGVSVPQALAVSVFVDSEPLWASLYAAPRIGKLLRDAPTTHVDLRAPHDGFIMDGLFVPKAVGGG